MQTVTPMSFEEAAQHAALASALELENQRLIGMLKNQRALSRRVADSREEIRRLASTLRRLEGRT